MSPSLSPLARSLRLPANSIATSQTPTAGVAFTLTASFAIVDASISAVSGSLRRRIEMGWRMGWDSNPR